MSLEPLHFLALGDSYTIGESVDSNERWPELLVGALRKRGVAFADPLIVGVEASDGVASVTDVIELPLPDSAMECLDGRASGS